MTNRSVTLDDRLHSYLLGVSLREPPILAQLRNETAEMPEHNMQIAPEQGQFMALLVRLMNVRRYLEVGVFTGYSSLAVALAMPREGHVTALDVSADFTRVARRFWQEAGVADRIDLRLNDALESLDALLEQEATQPYDMAFIDADKRNYAAYYEKCLELVRPGGIVAIDNTLWHGTVADPRVDDADTEAIRSLNMYLHTDDRIDLSLVPIGDGLTLCRKR